MLGLVFTLQTPFGRANFFVKIGMEKNTDFKQIETINSIGSLAPCLTRPYKENTNHGTLLFVYEVTYSGKPYHIIGQKVHPCCIA